MKKKNYFLLLYIALFSLFFLFLIFIPDMVAEKDESVPYKYTPKNDETEALIFKQTKYDLISDEINSILNQKIENQIQDSFLKDLILKNKISNTENSLLEEITILFEKGDFETAKNLSEHFINLKLNEFDKGEEKKWRNIEILVFKEKNSEYELFQLYNYTPVLRKPENAKVSSFSKEEFFLPENIEYIFYKNDNSTENILIDLKNKSQLNKIANYFEGSNLKENFSNYETKIIYSKKKYLLQILIWE